MANYLSIEKRKRIFHLLCEGNGLRSITRLVKCSTTTVSAFQNKYCQIIEYINRDHFSSLKIDEIEADEIRTFVKTKNNIRWIFIAMCRKSRCVLHFHIGDRDTDSARKFIVGLGEKLNSEYTISTDSLLSYQAAVSKNKYGRYPSDIKNATVLRGENPGKVLGRAITNRVERHNGTVRQHVARLIRRTRCFSKKEEALRQHLTLFFFYYNFIKINRALNATPVLAAGISDEAYWEDKLLEYDLLFSEGMRNKDNRGYGVIDVGENKVKTVSENERNDFLRQMLEISGYTKKEKERGEYKKQAKVIKLAS